MNRFPGHVTLIYPTLNAETRTARIRVEHVNCDGLLKPGMYGTVQIGAGPKSEVLMVPDSAVIVPCQWIEHAAASRWQCRQFPLLEFPSELVKFLVKVTGISLQRAGRAAQRLAAV